MVIYMATSLKLKKNEPFDEFVIYSVKFAIVRFVLYLTEHCKIIVLFHIQRTFE